MKRAPVMLGDTVPQYSVASYTPIPRGISSEDVWQLIGPTVDMHIRRLPLWRVFCAVYLEGLAHGSQAALAAHKEKQ